MKAFVPLILSLVIAGAFVAGCKGNQPPATTAPTTVPVTTVATSTQITSFTLAAPIYLR